MDREQLQFQIAQYAAGTLNDGERREVDQLLASDADAREMLAEEERLTVLLRAVPMPEIDVDAMARRILTATAVLPMPRRETGWAGFSPLRLSLAASVIIAAGLAIPILSRSGPNDSPVVPTGNSGPSPIAQPIVIRAVDPTQSPASEIIRSGQDAPSEPGIAVGPSPEVNGEDLASRYADILTTRPSRVDIATPPKPAQDKR